ncbi:hypothetical protein [Parvularcula sp. LCG005]|uniref:hypothetical protein n=1 Tax=Parvularcula sp. LCG005 TaxID=3078805 RepID=UPI002941DB33|nr:hypothetical protein [Parvularcula sp. LCG005]WOI52487.1 hypothetical protein RUI03_10045 [Parvularcula sp. LCG005]
MVQHTRLEWEKPHRRLGGHLVRISLSLTGAVLGVVGVLAAMGSSQSMNGANAAETESSTMVVLQDATITPRDRPARQRIVIGSSSAQAPVAAPARSVSVDPMDLTDGRDIIAGTPIPSVRPDKAIAIVVGSPDDFDDVPVGGAGAPPLTRMAPTLAAWASLDVPPEPQ